MPNAFETLSAFIHSGNPDTLAVSLPAPLVAGGAPPAGDFSNYAPGQLGRPFFINDRAYLPVVLDSGAVSANPVGSVAANHLLYWKDKAARIVTNDPRQAVSGSVTNAFRNFVAGVARTAVAAPGAGGTLVAALAKGLNIPVKAAGTGGAGAIAIASATAATVEDVVVGSSPGYQALGVFRNLVSGGVANVDLDVPLLP